MEHIAQPDPMGALRGKDVSLYRSAELVRGNRISSETSASHFNRVFKEGKETELMKHFTGPARSLREHILKLSLFPNIHNRETMLKEFQ